MNEITCPYCNEETEVNHDDGAGYSEDEYHEMECEHCEKLFVFTTYVSFSYSPQKADCLNDSDHGYKLTCTVPKEFSKMRCSMCGIEREMTDKERSDFKIKTHEDYFKELDK